MSLSTISLAAGSSTENLAALAEVQDFSVVAETGWTYRILPEPLLTAELARISNMQSDIFSDSITFQPCSWTKSQDRCVMESWNLLGGNWVFSAILDGHCGHETVDHVRQTLPLAIKLALQRSLETHSTLSSENVREILSECLTSLDNSIRSDFLDLFPGSENDIDRIAPSLVYDVCAGETDEVGRRLVLRCTQGAAVILALTDPEKKNQWVANLGDCQAVIGRSDGAGGWSAILVNSLHNGCNPSEIRRIRDEHPGETECISDDRVVGFLAPTRALGDTWLKLPAAYTRRIFANFSSCSTFKGRADVYAKRILTPPYIANIPDTYHHVVNSVDDFIILCSDGLPDLYEEKNPKELADLWVAVVGLALKSRTHQQKQSLSLCLLRDAIGGQDAEAVSRHLTLESEEQWMDDTSIIVQRYK